MANDKVVIQRNALQYRFWAYIPEYGKLYKFLRVVAAVGGVYLFVVFFAPNFDEKNFLYYMTGGVFLIAGAVIWTLLIHGLNALLDKIFWYQVTCRAEISERGFEYYEDGVCLHRYKLAEISVTSNIKCEEQARENGKSIKLITAYEKVKVIYKQNGEDRVCDLSGFEDSDIEKFIAVLEKYGFSFKSDRAFKESRWIFANTNTLDCEIYDNGDMRFSSLPTRFPAFNKDDALLTTVNLHDFIAFSDISYPFGRARDWSYKLCATDKAGQKHEFFWGFSHVGIPGTFEKMKGKISEITGLRFADERGAFDPSSVMSDESYEELQEKIAALTPDETAKRKKDIDFEIAMAVVGLSMETDRLRALNMDAKTTAMLIGDEAGNTYNKIRELREEKKKL